MRIFQHFVRMIFLWAAEDRSSDVETRFGTSESEGRVTLSFLQNLYLTNKYL